MMMNNEAEVFVNDAGYEEDSEGGKEGMSGRFAFFNQMANVRI
jgi:hypothetical protein